MNLIEQLGGYEKAKEYLLTLVCAKNDAYSWSRLIQEENIKQALLQYRRENNIFEEGDAIVRRWNNRVYWIITNIDNGSEFMISENKNAKFKDCKVCDMPCNFTFATDKEIAQGYRDE